MKKSMDGGVNNYRRLAAVEWRAYTNRHYIKAIVQRSRPFTTETFLGGNRNAMYRIAGKGSLLYIWVIRKPGPSSVFARDD